MNDHEKAEEIKRLYLEGLSFSEAFKLANKMFLNKRACSSKTNTASK